MKKDFMKDILQHDFKVSLLAEEEDSNMYVGYRPVLYQFLVEQDVYLFHYHIPRYLFASRFGAVMGMDWNKPDLPLYMEITKTLGALKFTDEIYGISAAGRHFKVNEEKALQFHKELDKDFKRFSKASKLIKKKKPGYCLDGIITPGGSEIFHKDEFILHAVAFDYLLSKKKHFGAYELYSDVIDGNTELTGNEIVTMADFLAGTLESYQKYQHEIPKRKEEAADNYKAAFLYDFEVVSNGLTLSQIVHETEKMFEVYGKVQDVCLDRPVWGKDIKADKKVIEKGIRKAFNNLAPEMKVVFKRLYGLHGSTAFLILAFIHQIIDADKYCEPLTRGYQPDSKEEQSIRAEANIVQHFISLLENNE